jgi:hypothetical protein
MHRSVERYRLPEEEWRAYRLRGTCGTWSAASGLRSQGNPLVLLILREEQVLTYLAGFLQRRGAPRRLAADAGLGAARGDQAQCWTVPPMSLTRVGTLGQLMIQLGPTRKAVGFILACFIIWFIDSRLSIPRCKEMSVV